MNSMVFTSKARAGCRSLQVRGLLPALGLLLLAGLACGCGGEPPLVLDQDPEVLPDGSITATTPPPSIPPEIQSRQPGNVLRFSTLYSKSDGLVCKGYSLVYLAYDQGLAKPRCLLLDMDGKVVNQWNNIMGQPVKMLPGGSLMGGRGIREGVWDWEYKEIVQQSWNSVDEWSFSNWDADGTNKKMARSHHDFQREGNPVGYWAPGQEALLKGKTLVLSHKKRLVPSVSKYELVDDVIFEVEYSGAITGPVWYAADHVEGMGFTEQALEAIYLYPGHSDEDSGDWLHINSISYLGKNPWFDKNGDERFNPQNIIFTSREANFIAIISRKTGDIVWRMGPDILPGMPEYSVDQFVGPHHGHMIPYGLPGAGNILVFDNGGNSGYGAAGKGYQYGRGLSRVVEFNPVTRKLVWEYQDPKDPNDFISIFMGGAQRLPNGNTLIASGTGISFEVTPASKTVWKLEASSLDKGFNFFYRQYRIPPEWLPAGKNVANYLPWSLGGCAPPSSF